MSKKGYLDEDDFYYQIVLSKGKGLLTKKAEIMIKLIGDNTIIKLKHRYKSDDDMNDCCQSGLLHMYINWYSFNEKRFKVAMPYFTEVFTSYLLISFLLVLVSLTIINLFHSPDIVSLI